MDSKLFPIGRWLMCPPEHFDVCYSINPWMNTSVTPDAARARTQWNNLFSTLKGLGAQIDIVKPQPKWPDMVFTANAGLIHGKRCVLTRFRHAERKGEEPFFKAWFEANGYELLSTVGGEFEGEGDALFAGETLFAGCGIRTDQRVYDEIASFLGVRNIVYCELINPRFYHLDTCFCPLNSTQALYVEGAFSAESLAEMKEAIELFPVSSADAERFACNSVVLERSVVLPAGCDDTRKLLETLGYVSFPCELDEFKKAGGSAKCLSLRIGA